MWKYSGVWEDNIQSCTGVAYFRDLRTSRYDKLGKLWNEDFGA